MNASSSAYRYALASARSVCIRGCSTDGDDGDGDLDRDPSASECE